MDEELTLEEMLAEGALPRPVGEELRQKEQEELRRVEEQEELRRAAEEGDTTTLIQLLERGAPFIVAQVGQGFHSLTCEDCAGFL